MEIGVVRGLMTLMLMIAFVGVVAWAYSRKRRDDFAAAARLPLEEEDRSGSDSA